MDTTQVNDLNALTAQFRATNDAMELEVKKFGVASLETKQTLDRISDDLSKSEERWQKNFDAKMKDQDTAYTDRFDRLEALVAKKTPHTGSSQKSTEDERAFRKEAFFKHLRHESLDGLSPRHLQKSFESVYPEHAKALILSDDTKGGYLAPTEYVMEMIKDLVEFSPIRSICRIRSTSRPSITMPKRRTTAAASWTAETQSRPETTNPSFGVEEIKTHELYAMIQVSKIDLEDTAFDLEQFLNEEFVEQFGVSEGLALVSGNGVAKPEGFTVAAGVATVKSGHATLITADGLINLYHELKEGYLANSSFVFSRPTLREIRKLKDGQGQYLWAPGIRSEARPAELLGRPYVTATDMASIAANAVPIAFGDFRRAMLIVDRLNMEMMTDPYTAKSTGMIELSARRRIGGQVILPEAIKLQKIEI